MTTAGPPPRLAELGAALERAAVADLAREHERRLRRRRLLLRAALATAGVAAVALGAVGVVSRGAPTGAQPAYARVVRGVLAALDQAPNTILHVTVNGTETTTTGHSTSWTDESYLSFGPLPAGFSWPTVETGFRQIITQPGGLDAETAATDLAVGNPPSDHAHVELYDPTTNTIYTGAPALPAGTRGDLFVAPGPGPNPSTPHPSMPPTAAPHFIRCMALGSGLSDESILTEMLTTSRGPVDPPVLADTLATIPYMGPNLFVSVLGDVSSLNDDVPDPWAPDAGTLLKDALSAGCARVVGYATVDDRKTLEITGPPQSDITGPPYGITGPPQSDWAYYADAGTFKPVELDLTGAGDSNVKLRFQAYQQLRMAGNTGLLSLSAQHPGATIDADTGDYESAQARLFPTLTEPVCVAGIINPICGSVARTSRLERHRRSSARSS